MSIQNNLRLAKPDMTEDEMRRVCELACIAKDIEAMQDGYDSTIGEGGVSLSGGQRQRLAIARALLKDCSVLLLDEATSALDNQIQRKIQTAINNIRGDRTILIIAHRLSTIVDADEIMFIEDGRVLDHGSHEELLARCGSYRELYEADAGNSALL
jgi:ABC-type multidrug transport system fused ATPase/permease subunit